VAFWTLAFSFLLISLKDRWLQFCLLSIFMVVLVQAFVWWWYPHYGAPLVPLVLAAVAISSRHIVLAFKHSTWARKTAPAIVTLIAVILVAPGLVAKPASAPVADKRGRESFSQTASQLRKRLPTPFLTRSDVIAHLERLGGTHLVFVRYDDDFPFSREWVWNAADMQAARVIFAHDLGVKNQLLMAAHADRTVWFIQVSRKHGELMADPRD
jgi:hypothetical protein